MDFDEMFEAWRAQNAAPPYDANPDVLRQALRDEEAKVAREMRTRRRGLWFAWLIGAGMAVFAGFWIAITIANGWATIYVVTSAVSLALFALGVGALWASRGREPERRFGNTLEEEVRRSLALVDYQLSLTRRWILPMVGAVSIVVGAMLFSWTTNKSQDIPTSGGWGWPFVLIVFFVWAVYKGRDETRRVGMKLELRQRRLREVLAGLTDRE